MLALSVLSFQYSFVEKKHKGYTILHKVAIASFQARTRNLMFIDCRMCSFYRKHLCLHWDKFPGPGPGMTLSGALYCYFVDAHFLKTKEHKNKREHWKSNVLSSKLDVLLPFNVSASLMLRLRLTFVGKNRRRAFFPFFVLIRMYFIL